MTGQVAGGLAGWVSRRTSECSLAQKRQPSLKVRRSAWRGSASSTAATTCCCPRPRSPLDAGLLASCTGTIQLPNGQVTFAWLNSPPPRKQLAVTGGTGHFRTVRGDGTLVEFATGPTGSLTLRLLL